jgi:3-(3-hydroxy-phenyl)propionate hydroxylase
VDLRWKHRVTGIEQDGEGARLQVETPDGIFELTAGWVIACDGCNSDLRGFVGAPFEGQAFMDRFLIADVKMRAEFPTERWFWFDPPFHPEQSTLLHRQADDVWRIDFQLGWDADPEEESRPERVIPRVRAMLGDGVDFDLEWVSVYQFKCRRIDRFRYGRVLFAGDAAHQVSPFGARGANSGIQDVDNLCWKLAMVLAGEAPEALRDSYHEERSLAADDNIRQSTRSTDFMTPKSNASRAFRDAVLELAEDHAFARPFVNSGRLSTPTPYHGCSHVTAPAAGAAVSPAPGDPCPDAPVRCRDGSDSWLLRELPWSFSLLAFGSQPAGERVAIGDLSLPVLRVDDHLLEVDGVLRERFTAGPETVLLLRPDQYIAARWEQWDGNAVAAALARATTGRAA